MLCKMKMLKKKKHRDAFYWSIFFIKYFCYLSNYIDLAISVANMDVGLGVDSDNPFVELIIVYT